MLPPDGGDVKWGALRRMAAEEANGKKPAASSSGPAASNGKANLLATANAESAGASDATDAMDANHAFTSVPHRRGLLGLGKLFGHKGTGNAASRGGRKDSHSNKVFDEFSPAFDMRGDNSRRRSFFAGNGEEDAHVGRPAVRGLSLRLSDAVHQVRLLARTMLEFLLAVAGIAGFFTLLLQGVDTHLTDGRDAGIGSCFMVMVCFCAVSVFF